nr:gamma-secretase subunit PEN-2 isoform X1 [Chrysemys picta bellii]
MSPNVYRGRSRSRDYNSRHAARQAHALSGAPEVSCPCGRGRHESGAGPQRGEAQPVPEILPGCPAFGRGAAVLGGRADHMGHHLPDTPGPLGRAGRLPVLHHSARHPLMAPRSEGIQGAPSSWDQRGSRSCQSCCSWPGLPVLHMPGSAP